MKIVALMCRMAKPYGPKILLATFETAIVESGIHNLDYGDADSHGVFQQQWTQGWGSLADTMDPPTRRGCSSTRRRGARRYPDLSAGQLAAKVQRPREDLRGRVRRRRGPGRQALIREHC